MSLRFKALLVGATTMGVVIVILMVAAYLIISDSFARLEQQDTEAHVARALNALEDDLGRLDRTTNDYAAWDDTYAFMGPGFPNYIEGNYGDTTYNNNHLNLVMLIKPDGQVIFAKAYDLIRQQELPVSAAMTDLITGNARLMHPAPPQFHDGSVDDASGAAAAGVALRPDGRKCRPLARCADYGAHSRCRRSGASRLAHSPGSDGG